MFASLASGFRILHLATHGVADERVGDYSYLAFASEADSIANELLYVRDLYNLQLNADMVVLSACQTALGRLQRGEGIISLARAFAYAGARSIVTTLWSVEDASTKTLMLAFYRHLQAGMPKDQALQQAKLEWIANAGYFKAHPYCWAGLIVIGDAKEIDW